MTSERWKQVALFMPKIVGGGASLVGDKHQYAVARDGQLNLANGTAFVAARVTVSFGWTGRLDGVYDAIASAVNSIEGG